MADNNLNENVKLSERLKALRESINKLESKTVELTQKESEFLEKQISTLSKLEKIQEKRIKNALGNTQAELDLNTQFSQQKASLSSISSVYSSLTKQQQASLNTSQSLLSNVQQDLLANEDKKSVLDSTLSGINTLQGLQQKLAESGPENAEQQAAIRDEYAAQVNKVRENIFAKQKLGQITASEAAAMIRMVNTQKEGLAVAEKYGTQSEMSKEVIEKQIQVYKGIQKTILGVINTAKTLTSTVGGVVGSLLIGMGSVISKVGETTREFGGFVGGLTGATGQTTLLKLAFKDASAVTKELANQFGGVEGTSFRTRLNTNLMAVNMGISGESAAKLVGTLARTGGMTAQQAMDLAESTKQFAKQNGVIPSQAMEDIAQNSELFASYGASATEELAKSAVQAAKLGVSMSTLGKVTDGLLDFESSITKELELSAMLGRNINLNRARGLAFEGKTGAAVKETIKQLGGAAAFERMNVIQRRQAAEALGLSVDELDKMAKNMDKLNDDGTMQLSTFDTLKQSLTAIATGPLGQMVQGIGSSVIAMGQLNTGLSSMGTSLGGVVGGMKNFVVNSAKGLANIIKMGAQKLFGGGAGEALSGIGEKLGGIGAKAKDKIGGLFGKGGGISSAKTPDLGGAGKSGKGISSLTDSIGKIKMSDVVKGAAALVLIAGAMFILGKALQEFQGIGLDTLGIAGLALLGLTLSLAAVGAIMNFAGPWILAGAGAMILIAGAMYILGKALQEIAKVPDFDFVSLGKQVLAFGALISPLGLLFIPLSLAAVSLGILGAGMAVFGKGVSQVPTGIDFAQLGKDVVSFAISLSSLGKYIFSLTLAGIALGIAGAGLAVFGAGLSLIPVDVLDSLTNMVTNLVPLTDGISSLASAFSNLAGSLALVGIAGIAALPALIALTALGPGLSLVSGLFGGGSSEKSENREEESISEYQQLVIQGLADVKQAISDKNMNVYLDGKLLTDFVRANSDGGGNQGATLLNAGK